MTEHPETEWPEHRRARKLNAAEAEIARLRRALADEVIRAAAPELLEALKKAETLLNHMGDILNGLDAVTAEDVAMAAPIFEAVRAAIIKAEGTGK
jgi:hypothetical protein